jgi:hypothetical protein
VITPYGWSVAVEFELANERNMLRPLITEHRG